MNELEKIDDYFNGQMTDEEKRGFELSLQTDPELADAVAFYVMAKRAAQKEAIEQRQVVQDKETEPVVRPLPTFIGKWIAYAGSAAAAIVLMLRIFFASPSVQQLADNYIDQSFAKLPGNTMGAATDSLQRGIQLYNQGKLTEAGTMFNALLTHNPNNYLALEGAGAVALRTDQYDQAIVHFDRLAGLDLQVNHGRYYEALALLKRNRPADQERARLLLTQVATKDADHKASAENLLEKLE